MATQCIDDLVSPGSEYQQRGVGRVFASGTASQLDLTPREREILHHLSWRATDREIADTLSISPRTVMHHVSNILGKMGAANRREAALLAAQHKLA